MPRPSTIEIANEWVDEIKKFLIKYGFEKINGGDSFSPGNRRNQIDLVACIKDTVFIIECKTKAELGRSYLRSEINKFLTKARIAETAMKRGYPAKEYVGYKDFRFVFATKNIDWNCDDLIGEGENKVYSWDDSFFDYYNALFDSLNIIAAQPQLLGELKVFSLSYDNLEIPAIKTVINNINLYSFITSPLSLVELCCVARREFKKTEYYQRMVDGNRLNKIIAYLDTNKDPPFEKGRIIPGNIIMCTHHGPHESPLTWTKLKIKPQKGIKNVEMGVLTIRKRQRSLWIIDGQHRFYSFLKNATRSPQLHDRILVTILEDMRLGQQREIFLDVNLKQVKVPADYVLDMYGDINPNNINGIISNIIKKINLMEKINFSRSRQVTNFFYYKIKIPSHGTVSGRTRKPYGIVGFFNAIKKFNLAKETTHSTLTGANNNPFYNTNSYLLIGSISKGICDFFAVMNKELEGTNFYEKLISGGDTKGHMYVALGLFERIISAYVKEKGVRKPGLRDYSYYLLKFKEYIESLSPSEYQEIINTSGDKNRINTIKKLCLGMKELGAFGFQYFNDLDPGKSELIEDLMEFEKDIRDFLNTKMSRRMGWEEWCTGSKPDILPKTMLEDMINKSQLKKKITNLNARGIPWDKKNNYIGMTLGQVFDIIKKREIWEGLFQPIFFKEFSDKEAFEASFKNVRDVRNKLIHDSGPETLITSENLDICRTQLKQFNKCLKDEEWDEEPLNLGEEDDEIDEEIKLSEDE